MAYRALYRKYRPETFADVVGQAHIVDVLKNQISGGRIAHAYLFTGPRGTGKTSTAKIFAKAINCLSRKGVEPCLSCASCESIALDNSVDVVEIDAASNNGGENIRDIRENANLMPAIGKYKVYIIDEVHMLSQGAFNALLKTLEEPPSHVVFILATTEPKKLPATILSRCQKFDFKRHSVADMVTRMEYVTRDQNIEAEKDALVLIARTALGGMRDALSILDQCTSGADTLTVEGVLTVLGGANRETLLSLTESITAYDEKNAILKLEDLKDSGADIKLLLKDLAYIFLAMLYLSKGADALSAGVSDDEAEKLKEMGQRFGQSALLRAVETLVDSEVRMRMNSLPDIILETAVIRLMSPQIDASADDKTRLERLEAVVQGLKDGVIASAPPKQEKKPEPKQPVPAKATAEPAAAKPADKAAAGGMASKNSEAGWTKALNAIRDKDGYLYPYAKQMRLASDSDGALTFYAPEGAAFSFLIDADNHQRVEAHLKAEFGEGITLTIKPEKKEAREAERAARFAEDMFEGIEIKEI
mgnify:CR=1 FL=1